jgi:excinuclease ABC subunit A
VLDVLDELTTGLHASDADWLLVQLPRLANAGNIVVMVERDMHAVAQADWVIDVGPGAGDAGGRVVVAGSPGQVAGAPDSRTAPFLAQELTRGICLPDQGQSVSAVGQSGIWQARAE